MLTRLIGLIGMIVLLTVGVGAASPAHADQSLPPYAWYTVVWQQPADTLHWVGPLGEVASIARPKLPNEIPGSPVQLGISPDGRYLVIAAALSNPAVEGLGIYDLQAGQFVQTHNAQPNETIHLGPQSSFSPFSGKIAVGFKSGDYNNPAWRVILFDLATGNALNVLDHTHPSIPGNQLMIPSVREFGLDEGLGEEVVHFQLIPYGTGGALEYPAYAWMPDPAPINQAIAVQESPYIRVDSDINFLSRAEVYTYSDPNYPQLGPLGPAPNHNAIRANSNLIWVDGSVWNSRAHWAANSQWVLFFADNGQGVSGWSVILANGTPQLNQRKMLPQGVSAVAGTPDGYVYLANNTLFYTNSFDNTTGAALMQSDPGQEARIVYVTPAGVQFKLTALGDGTIVANPGNVAAPQTCPGAPSPRLTVGQSARVTYTDGVALNLRNAPGGSLVTQLPEGTVVSVINGPQCQDGYNWWQIQVTQGAAVGGWAAEGTQQSYFLEPWAIGVPPGNVAPVPTATQPQFQIATIAPTATPMVFQVAPVATATPLQLQLVPGVIVPTAAPQTSGDCTLAPQQHVGVGVNIITYPNDGTYALFYNLSDNIPQQQIPPGTHGTVIGGWGCRNGYRMWQVQFNLNGQTVTGFISEGTASKYFIGVG